MLFSSFSFLLWFLPATLLLYFLPAALARLLRREWRLLPWQNGVLLVMSLLFYAWGEPLYLFLMIGTVLLDTALGLRMARSHARLWLTVGLTFHLGALFFFKYFAFFAGVLGLSVRAPRLPLGISFYTFQAISYLIDVRRKRVTPARNPALLGVYIALFPQLIAGPIVRYTDVDTALRERKHTLHGAAAGTRRFAAGLCKKLLLANPMGALFRVLIARGSALTATGAWGALLAFSFQLYFDFSGYSDMAIGLGRIFGFRFPENFNYPYVARSVSDFWRRWHITLSSFFREYLYFPLGGSRRGAWRTVRNLLVVWALTGLWHGAAWNFILWGLYYFLLLVLEKFVFFHIFHPVPAPIARFFTSLAILGGWLLFAFDGSLPTLTLGALGGFVAALLGTGGLAARAELYELLRHGTLFALCALGSTPLPRRIYRQTVRKKRLFWLRTALPLAGLFLAAVALSDASFNPFLYFRF